MLNKRLIASICSIMIIGSTFVVPRNIKAKEISSIENLSKEEIVNIPDVKLREVINYTLGGKDRKPDTVITKVEMESLKELSSNNVLKYLPREQWIERVSHDRGIRSIEGLQYAINLEKLDLCENGIKDLTPLKNLNKLNYIDLHRNMLGDLSPLSNLTNLIHLNVYNNDAIVDIEPISNLKKLEWLDLHWCNRGKKPVNVQPLGKLTNMKELNLESNLVSDISFTKTLKKLTLIGVGANNITDMSPLSHLIMKAYVDWDGTYVGMLAQNLKQDININLDYKKSTYKIKDPVKGLDEYMKANECSPEVRFLSGEENKDVLLKYNNETKEIEVNINENLEKNIKNIKTTINLDYGFYSLAMKLNIFQGVNPKFKNTVDSEDKEKNHINIENLDTKNNKKKYKNKIQDENKEKNDKNKKASNFKKNKRKSKNIKHKSIINKKFLKADINRNSDIKMKTYSNNNLGIKVSNNKILKKQALNSNLKLHDFEIPENKDGILNANNSKKIVNKEVKYKNKENKQNKDVKEKNIENKDTNKKLDNENVKNKSIGTNKKFILLILGSSVLIGAIAMFLVSKKKMYK